MNVKFINKPPEWKLKIYRFLKRFIGVALTGFIMGFYLSEDFGINRDLK